MSSINIKDFKKSDFKKIFRGYDPIEVDAFLETISLRYERLLEENESLSEKIQSLTNDIQVYKENEATLQRAIVKSQDLAEEIINNAKKKAENLVKEGELQANAVFLENEKELLNRKQELEELKIRNDKLVEDVKLFFMEKLNEMDEFIKARNVYKMELAKLNQRDDEPDEESGLKKISINTAKTNFSE